MKTIRFKNGTEAYENWRNKRFLGQREEEANQKLDLDLVRAEPDLLPAPEDDKSPELEAALEVLNSGGLTTLTGIQQKVFQLSVVEGLSGRKVGSALGISEMMVRKHLKALGKKLKHLCKDAY